MDSFFLSHCGIESMFLSPYTKEVTCERCKKGIESMKRKAARHWKTEAWKQFSFYVRMNGAMETTGTLENARCCTCNKIHKISFIQAGHCIGGRNNSILFEPNAVHPQCKYCNEVLGGNYIAFKRFIDNKYGAGEWERLKALSRQIKIYSTMDFQEIYERYKILNSLYSAHEDTTRRRK